MRSMNCRGRSSLIDVVHSRSIPSFRIRGPIARPDLPGLCARVCKLLASKAPTTVVCDVYGIDTNAVTVDALARLQLAARRHGCQVLLRGASEDLRALVALMGL